MFAVVKLGTCPNKVDAVKINNAVKVFFIFLV